MTNKKVPLLSIIVPTLNEEEHLKFLLSSLRDQILKKHEILIIDGGSVDKTKNIAQQFGAKVISLPKCSEFPSRNIGAKMAKGELLFFTCADVILPNNLLHKVVEKFKGRPELIALTGPGYPLDAPFVGKIEYLFYNIVRLIIAHFPKSVKRFSTSTNFLVVRKDSFDKTKGFNVNEINADGIMGKRLSKMGEVAFLPDTFVYISARRMKNMGFLGFNKHYIYVLENLFFFLSNTQILRTFKLRSTLRHPKMHEN